MSQISYKLDVHPLTENEFIGTVDFEKLAAKEDTTSFETVIILDRSGSMGQAVPRVTNKILPMVLSKLSYSSKKTVHLITFDTVAEAFNINSDQMKRLQVNARGGTVLSPAVIRCQQQFQLLTNKKPIRLLTISDGEVVDIEDTQRHTAILASYLKHNHYTINSQAVRLFTSSSQPDTTALASLLQINNVRTPRLADISTAETDESLAQKIADLFLNDGLGHGRILTTNEKVIKKFPWEPVATNQFTLTPGGNNLFWLTAVPDSAHVEGSTVVISKQQQLTLPDFQKLLRGTISNINDHMKILKVVGTDTAEETVTHMLEYFKKTEEELMKASNGQDDHHKFFHSLAAIAKDDKIRSFTSAEKAFYLQQNHGNNVIGGTDYENRLKICQEAKRLHEEEEEAKKLQLLEEEAKKRAEEEAEKLQLIEEAKKIAEKETKKLQLLEEEAKKRAEEKAEKLRLKNKVDKDNEAKKRVEHHKVASKVKEAKVIFSRLLENTKKSVQVHLNEETMSRRDYMLLLVPVVAVIVYKVVRHH